MPELQKSAAAETTIESKLFVPSERWGWEFVEPVAPQPSPMMSSEPMWHEPAPPPPPPPPKAPSSTGKTALKGCGLFYLVACGALFGLGLAVVSPILALLCISVIGAIWWWAVSHGKGSVERKNAQAKAVLWKRDRQSAYDEYQRQFKEWSAVIVEHDQRERSRFNAADLWYPLEIQTPTDRVDVVGGVPDGWRQLLTTYGATVLAGGNPMLVLDLTQEQITDRLEALSTNDWEVQALQLPRDGAKVDLLGGLDAEGVAEMLAEATATLRVDPDAAARTTDADLLRTVVNHLDGRITAARLAAGVRVLQRSYDPDDGLLTPAEVGDMTRQIDLVGTGERVQDQLRFLRASIDLLVHADGGEHQEIATIDGLWSRSDLTVIATDSSSRARKDFADRVLFHSLLQRLWDRGTNVRDHVLVIAGADHLGGQALEAMAKQARARGVRLVYLFEHLRDATQRLLGASHSASIIMRLGNSAEAAAAAEYIGHGYSFKLSQITRQLGVTDTVGGGSSRGITTSSSSTRQLNSGPGGLSSGRSHSQSISEVSQEMDNWTRADSTTDGTTHQRVYEFEVEPRSIQTLPVTALVLVEGSQHGRRAVVADCNPAISLIERVAAAPQHLGQSQTDANRW